MTAPAILSCQIRATNLYLIFDRAITASAMTGITATIQPTGAANTLTFGSVSGNTLSCTMAAAPTTGQTVAVSMVSGNTIRDVATGLSEATPFTTTAVDAYIVPTLTQVVAGYPLATQIMLQFSRPIASSSGDLATGFSVTVNGAAITGTITATLSPNQTRLYLTIPSSIPYSAPVVVTYDKSTGNLFTQLLPTSHSNGTTYGAIGTDTISIVGTASNVTGSTGTVSGTQVAEVESFTVTALTISTTYI